VADFSSLLHALGRRIVIVRNAARLTQAELAKKTGLSRASIASVESGRKPVKLQTVWLLAQALGVSLQDLLRDDEVSLQRPAEEKPRSPDEAAWLKKLEGGEQC
jgi:transcriptional regulator with XRE-family HTH domain